MAVNFQTITKNATEEVDRLKILASMSRQTLQRRKDWAEEAKALEHEHKQRMFDMVHRMTIITYFTVLIVVLTQLFNFRMPSSFIDFIQLGWIDAERLSTEKFALILTGFLAELLLLPKIILNGLFNGKEIKEQG